MKGIFFFSFLSNYSYFIINTSADCHKFIDLI